MSRQPRVKKLPKLKDVRRVTKFAFLPTFLSIQETVWLERYYSVETYCSRYENLHVDHILDLKWHKENCGWIVQALVPYDNHTEVHMLTLKK